ncbi:MAG: ThiF family adenylyltransferase, partial [Erysipelotrichaceae bacterium]
TNLNRQLIAYHNTIGLKKVWVMQERLLSINPNLIVTPYDQHYDDDHLIDLSPFDYVVDAIDSVKSKLRLMQECEKADVPLIMSLGTGNKLNPSQLLLSDLYHTSICPLAKKVRTQAKALGLKNIKVVYSKEEPHKAVETKTIASMMMVPASAGLLIASEVIRDIIKGV